MNVVPRQQVQWTELPSSSLSLPMSNMQITALERGPADLIDHLDSAGEHIQPYKSGAHLINLYSWRPYISDPEYSFALESQNVMNTLQSELYFTYNRNEQSKKFGFDALYGAWFPWLDLGISYTFDRNALFHLQQIYWNEWRPRQALVFLCIQPGGELILNGWQAPTSY